MMFSKQQQQQQEEVCQQNRQQQNVSWRYSKNGCYRHFQSQLSTLLLLLLLLFPLALSFHLPPNQQRSRNVFKPKHPKSQFQSQEVFFQPTTPTKVTTRLLLSSTTTMMQPVAVSLTDPPLLLNKVISTTASMSVFERCKTWLLQWIQRRKLFVVAGVIIALLLWTVVTVTQGNTVKDPEPMPFVSDNNADDDEQEEEVKGWGVGTVRSMKSFGKTNSVECIIDLPERNYYLPLALGQPITLFWNDYQDETDMATVEVYPFVQEEVKTGQFSILLPKPEKANNDLQLRKQEQNYDDSLTTLAGKVKLGDNVAFQPCKEIKLNYRGTHLPVTNIVYIAVGVPGIVPVLDQVRAILPNDDNAADTDNLIQQVTVLWIGERANDFDIIADLLEEEYYRNPDKVMITCAVDNSIIMGTTKGVDASSSSSSSSKAATWASSVEVQESIPLPYQPGTMAVLSGPSHIMENAMAFLIQERGYPKETICVM